MDQARLQDSWDVTLTVSKTDGTKLKVGDSSPETWTFTPKCPTGPCDVDLAGTLGGRPFTMILTRDGAVYRGQAEAHIAQCGSAQATSTLSLTVRVTDGRLDGAAWTASTWESSLELLIPYTRDTGNYYCPAQSAQFTVKPEGATATPNT